MPDIHIQREHHLGLAAARQLALRWADEAEKKFDMACRYEEGVSGDDLSFNRSGVSGTMRVTPEAFVLDARLGFLLGTFKDRIEAEIRKNLDALLASGAPNSGESKATAKKTSKKPAARKST